MRPVVKIRGIVLMRERARPPLPPKLTTGSIDDAYRVDLPEAYQEITLRYQVDGVAMRPLTPTFQRANNILLQGQVFPQPQLINHRAIGSNLSHHVTKHLLRVFIGGVSAAHQRG